MKTQAIARLVSLATIATVVAACGPLTPVEEREVAEPPPDVAPDFGASTLPDRSLLLSSVTCTISLPHATGGNGDLSYRLTPTIPDGTFDPVGRVLSVTPTTAGMWEMLYRVEDSDENREDSDAAELTFTIAVTDPADNSGLEEGLVSTYQGCGNQVFFLDSEGDSLHDELYTLILGVASADVYMIVTNATTQAIAPTIEPLSVAARPHAAFSLPAAPPPAVSRHSAVDDLWHTDPWMTDSDAAPPRPGGVFPSAGELRPPAREGDIYTFWDTFGLSRGVPPTPVTAIARRVVTDGTSSAVFRVENASWGTCDRCVSYEMVDAVANDFLAPGSDNDIHDWVTAVFGAPWGMHSYPDHFIPPEYANEVHFLILTSDKGYGAYFGGPHLGRADPGDKYDRYSSERLLVFLEVSSFQYRDGDLQEFLKHRLPLIGMTLAHEYQHMIRFYQKAMRQGAAIETWLDEMSSQIAAEFVAYKLMDAGLRGMPYDEPTAGSPPISNSGYGLYNYYNYLQASTWESEPRFYAHNFALGSYLALTYGGAPFMAAIAHNAYSGTEAIEVAITESGYEPTSFGDVLSDWAVANLLSDDTDAPSPFRYNTGEWSWSEAGGIRFRLGSVNLFNYRYRFGQGPNEYHDGPYFFPVERFNAEEQLPHSNRYVNLRRQTGTVQVRVSAPTGARIAVVVKEVTEHHRGAAPGALRRHALQTLAPGTHLRF